MKKAEKSFFVDNLSAELKAAKSALLINYSGLTVAAQQELKKRLKEAGSRMLVVKNSLLKLAGAQAKIDKELFEDQVLSGQTAIILASEDPIAPVAVLGAFAKEYETPKFKIGIVDGILRDEPALVKISNLPSKDALMSQLLGVLLSPAYGLVGVLNSNSQKLVYILSEKVKGGDN